MKRLMVYGAITGTKAVPVALKFEAAFAEFNAGFEAYFDRRGPGQGRMRSIGWLEAHREEKVELEARAEERREQQW